MRKTLLAVLALLSVVSAKADDIIVYKHNLKVTVTGGGYCLKRTFTGWTVIDGLTGDCALIEVEAKRKRFQVEQPEMSVQIVDGPSGKKSTVFKIESGRNRGLAIKGQNKTTDIFVLTPYEIPSRATATGNDLYQVENGTDYFFDEYKGSWVYDKKNTATPFNRTFEEKIQQFRNELIAKGYTEEI